MANAVQFVTRSARLQASERTRNSYLGLLNGDIAKAFGERTLAQMATPEAAEEVAAFLNVTIAHRSTVRRQHARMIIVWTMDAAVNADKIGRHKLQGITLTEGTAIPRRQRAAEEEDDESATGFVFVTDEQARTLAEGGAFPAAPEARSQRPRQLTGLTIFCSQGYGGGRKLLGRSTRTCDIRPPFRGGKRRIIGAGAGAGCPVPWPLAGAGCRRSDVR
jgi:hypothetical protein